MMFYANLLFNPDVPMPLPSALLCLAALYGLPAFTCWLAFRAKRKRGALGVGSLAVALAGYVAVVQLPRSREDFYFWFFVSVVPLIGSVVGVVAAARIRAVDESKRPNKSPEPTPTAVTPRATEGKSQ